MIVLELVSYKIYREKNLNTKAVLDGEFIGLTSLIYLDLNSRPIYERL